MVVAVSARSTVQFVAIARVSRLVVAPIGAGDVLVGPPELFARQIGVAGPSVMSAILTRLRWVLMPLNRVSWLFVSQRDEVGLAASAQVIGEFQKIMLDPPLAA